ncbi:MAG: tetratricopeptide repeat protein [Ignavibacteriae bacterium]|nr:tetratricopeptide repeat protein [Ignavibacteriota bacterium]
MKVLLCLMVVSIMFVGCGTSPEELYAQAEMAEKSQDFAKAVELYTELLNEHTSHELAERAAFNIARINNNDRQDFEAAIRAYRRYVELFPDGEKSAVSMFLIGYIYNNALNNLDSARAAYQRFLEKHPDHEMALSAKFELDHLGTPPEALLPEPAAKEIQQSKPAAKVAAKPTKKQ